MSVGTDLAKVKPKNLVPRLVGVLLVLAAVLKVWGNGHPSSFFNNYAVDEALRTLLIHVELISAAGCFSGLAPRIVRRVLLLLFSCFCAYALHLIAIGSDSCGCFGPLKIDPLWTFLLDAAVLTLLFYWQPLSNLASKSSIQQSARVFLICYGAFAIPTATWMHLYRPAELTENGESISSGNVVVLDPEAWLGQQFPVASLIDVGDQLVKGKWIVLLYHHECSMCQEALPQYIALSERLYAVGGNTSIALIEVPPFGLGPPSHLGRAVYGRLSSENKWFVQAPVEITIEDGIVTNTSLDLPAISPGLTKSSTRFRSPNSQIVACLLQRSPHSERHFSLAGSLNLMEGI